MGTPDKTVHVEVTDRSADRIGRGVGRRAFDTYTHGNKAIGPALRDHMAAQHQLGEARRHADNVRLLAAIHKHGAAGVLNPYLRHAPGVTAALRASIDNSRKTSSVERHGDIFHVHGPDVRTALNEAQSLSARRESQDRVRYGQG